MEAMFKNIRRINNNQDQYVINACGKIIQWFFDVLLTVHLSIILTINQINAQNLLL